MVNTLQLIVLMPLFKTNMPANASVFFTQIMEITAFDIFEITETLDYLLAIESKSPENENFATLGLESIFVVNNMGTLFIAYIMWGYAALATLIIK